MASTTVVSAPGKVLIAGGYLVLDPLYSGTVVSTSSRFYSVIAASKTPNQITVSSPQFVNAEWKYIAGLHNDAIRVDPDPARTSDNKFVELALRETCTLAAEIKGVKAVQGVLSKGLTIVIVGDNDFYSQRVALEKRNLEPKIENLCKIPPFEPTNVPISQVHKTGLGSSAALITSLTTALLIHLGVISSISNNPQDEGTILAHNLAQYVHCSAQGKIGSGFDVSAAVFGSQVYTRFNDAVLKPLMDNTRHTQPGELRAVLDPGNKAWTSQVAHFVLPPLTRLMLADVDAGSDTPSLVGNVLKWRNADRGAADKRWNDIDRSNRDLCTKLRELSDLHDRDPTSYASIVKYLSSLHSNQWGATDGVLPASQSDVARKFDEARKETQEIRDKMREMGNLSGVAIEPPEQTRLLDACLALSGVIGGGVPGAGGYDAIWLLVFDPPQKPRDPERPERALSELPLPVDRVESLWTSWTELSVSPLSAVESKAGQGVRVESLWDVAGLGALFSN